MIVRSRAWFILPLVLAPLQLQAADATNKAPTPDDAATVDALAGYVSPNAPDDPADLCDWSADHIITAPGVPPPTADAEARQMKTLLLKLARRLVEVQQKTPDPHIQAIINQSHLGDANALAALPSADAQQALIRTCMSLVNAAKTDTLAAHLADEFKISFKSGPPSPPASPPSTNAPASAST